jgi:anti-sigma regulatory factor (Ser/Thr protein kinase)
VDNAGTAQFEARRAVFDDVRTHIESACANFPPPAVERVVLIVEELFCNTIEHGYGGDSGRPVWLTLVPSDRGCAVRYRDAAPAHDPFAHATSPELPASPEQLPVGGLGVYLIGQFCTVKHYERHADHNVIELFVPVTVTAES